MLSSFPHSCSTLVRTVASPRLLLRPMGWLWLTLVALVSLARATPTVDFTDLTVEELGGLTFSAASKRAQPLFDTPAAVSVLLGEDIRRSGYSSVAEALRTIPGVHVANSNTYSWSVGIRGFNGVTSTKLLVLVDGRNVYSAFYGGVDWAEAEMPLEDLDRVEVVRGPGSSLWGANAMNGIINVVSKDARDTQGTLLSLRDGSEEAKTVYARLGGQAGRSSWYRIYLEDTDTRTSLGRTPDGARNNFSRRRAGFRLDADPAERVGLTWQADVVDLRVFHRLLTFSGEPKETIVAHRRYSTLGRLKWKSSTDDQLTVQFYADVLDQSAPEAFQGLTSTGFGLSEDGNTADLDLTHNLKRGRHELVWGGGTRRTLMKVESDGDISVQQPRNVQWVHNLFFQDQITVLPERLYFTAGTKLERHETVGWQLQPSVRLAYLPNPSQTWWAAVSRAVRSPSRVELDSRIVLAEFPPTEDTPPIQVDLVSDKAFKEEVLLAYEVGWRYRTTSHLTLEATAYLHDYSQLRDFSSSFRFEPEPPILVNDLAITNDAKATGYGTELSASWRVNDGWHLSAGATFQRLDVSAIDPSGVTGLDYSLPQHTFSFTSWHALPHDLELSISASEVGAVPALTAPGYIRTDVVLTWRPRADMEFLLGVQNALDDEHSEYGEAVLFSSVPVRRNIFAKWKWRF